MHDHTSGNVSYLLADRVAGEAVLIDPRAADVPAIGAMLRRDRLRLRWLLRTHEHDAMQPRESSGLIALGAPLLEHQVPCHGNGTVTFGREHLRVMSTPGHTRHCLSFAWRDRVFCGGLLAAGACAFQPLPALPGAMWDSVMGTLFLLPAETLLFTGHARQTRIVSTVREQSRSHPWFAGVDRDAFLARMQALAFHSPADHDDQAVQHQH